MFAKSALTAAALIAVFAGSQAADAKPICQINPVLCAKLPIVPVKPLNPVKFPLLPLQPVQPTPIKFPVIPLLPPQQPVNTPIKFPYIPILPPSKPIATPIKFPIIPVTPVGPLPPAPLPAPQPGIDVNVNIGGGTTYVPYYPGPDYHHHGIDPGYDHKGAGLTLASVNAGAIGPSAATQQQAQVATASCADVQQAVAQAGFYQVDLESCGKSDFIYDAKLFGGEYLVDVSSNGQLSNVISLTF